jgi:hypothetical protein
MIRVQQVGDEAGQNAATGADLWKAALRARTVLAPLGSAPGAADVALYGEVQRGLLIAVATEEARVQASATLLAAAAGLLSSLPAGSAELYLAAHPLSALSALSTMPILAAEPTPPDRADLLGGLLDRVMEDDRSEALRRLRVVVLDYALSALATSPALCARLETALAQGPARGLVVLASTTLSGHLPESMLAAFACRLLLGPCTAGAGELTRALPHGVALPALERTQALWVDRRARTGYLCLPWRLEREGAAGVLGIAPAVLDLPGNTADRPRRGRTLLVMRLLGALSTGALDGQPLALPGGLRQSQAELLAFLATRWGQCVPPDEVPPALLTAGLPTRMALARALPPDGGGGKGSVLAVHHEGDDMQVGLVEESVWVDSVAFAALCRAADATAGAGNRLALLERAIALYGGDFLGHACPPWAEAERTRLRTLYHEALRAAAELASAAGDHQQATLHAERLRSAVGAEDECATLLCLQIDGAAGNLAGMEEAYAAHRAALAAVEAGPPAAPVAGLYQDLVRRLNSSDTPGSRPPQVSVGGGAHV